MEHPPHHRKMPAWADLGSRAPLASLRDAFAQDPERAERHTIELGDLRVDLSRHLLDEDHWAAVARWGAELDLQARLRAQFEGQVVNVTEGRRVLHTALRLPAGHELLVDGVDVADKARRERARAAQLAHEIRDGHRRGATGQRIRSLVHLGIGGSALGPAMVTQALGAFGLPGFTCRFVSNVDGADLATALVDLDPETTIVVVASKTFTTLETMTNARAARRWLADAVGETGARHHLIGVTSDREAAQRFGIEPESVLEFWDWVGGRFSVASTIGFPVMVAIGPESFEEMLAGMHLVDVHAVTAPVATNVPMLMALVGAYYRERLGLGSKTVVPYSHDLARFPAFLQQLDMESNGKSVRLDGSPLDGATGPVVWGEPGTDAQHAFFQLLHQGTDVIPVDLIGFVKPSRVVSSTVDLVDHQDLLVANLLAQAWALATGRTEAEVIAAGVSPEQVPHRVFPGNRPSTVILAESLTPSTLGHLIALYEHIVAFQGLIWGVNSFDQWGVELGKELATRIGPALADPSQRDDLDPGTRSALQWMDSRR